MGSLYKCIATAPSEQASPLTGLVQTFSTSTSLSGALPLPDMFKLVYCIALTVGKRAIDIRLKCLLVCLVICLWRANPRLTRNFVAREKALKATDNTRNDLSISLFINQLLVPKQTCGSLYRGKTPAVYHLVLTSFYFNSTHKYAYHCCLILHVELRYEFALLLNASSNFLLKII